VRAQRGRGAGDARRRSGQRIPERQCLRTFSKQPCLTEQISKKLNKVVQAVNSKVVDLLTLYNFYKGSMAFFSTIFAQFGCQVADFLGTSNSAELH
jgi:hypothetical protein